MNKAATMQPRNSTCMGWILPKPATKHTDRSASREHTRNHWRYCWWTGQTPIN